MRKLILIFTITITIFNSHQVEAQVATLDWALSTKGSETIEKDFVVQLDGAGNVYEMGSYTTATDFDPGSGMMMLPISGARSVFFQKFNSNGDFLWAKALQGTGSALGRHMVTDSIGNMYVTGDFSGTIDFDPGAATLNLTSNGNKSDFWVAKLDSSGSLLWANAVGGTDQEQAHSISVDQLGNIYVVGNYRGTVDFDPGTGRHNLTSSGAADIFVQKLDAAGNLVWVKSMGGANSNDFGYAITTDLSNNVYLTGRFFGTVDFDPNTGVHNLSATGSGSASFVMKLTSDGNFRWANAMGGSSSYDRGKSLVTDELGHVYVLGHYRGTVDFDPSAGVANKTASGGGTDIYIQKLDTAGHFIWVGSIGGASNDDGACITTSVDGSVFVTGNFTGTADLDPSAGVDNHNSLGAEDVFIIKVDTSGNAVWTESLGGTGSDNGHALVVDAAENIYVTGDYTGTVDFDLGVGTYNMTSTKNTYDIFLMKFAQVACSPIKGSDKRTECSPFVWIDGKTYTANNNVATHNIVGGAANGCDSLVTLDLTITKVKTSVTKTGTDLSADELVATYQWLDCNNHYAMIPGATFRTYYATANGSYAVAVTSYGCTDTSTCYTISEVGVGIVENNRKNSISLYPNPTQNILNINAGDLEIENIKILNATGKISQVVPSNSKKLDISTLPKGLYFLQIQTENGMTNTSFIKN